MLERIRASIPALPPAEQRVARLLLTDPRSFATLPVSELADHSMSGAWIVAVFDWTMVRIGSRDCDANRFVVCVSTANAAPVSAV